MPALVADASVTIAWCFDDEQTAFTEKLLNQIRRRDEFLVACHWPLETMNALVQAKKRGRVTEERIQIFLRDLASFGILVDDTGDLARWNRVRHLAEKHRLTAYDAAYLELAQRT